MKAVGIVAVAMRGLGGNESSSSISNACTSVSAMLQGSDRDFRSERALSIDSVTVAHSVVPFSPHLWELAAAPKNTLFTHPRPSTTDEPHMNNCPHGLDGCEVRLCDPCARVPCVSRLPPRPRGLPRCLFTGTRSPGCPLCHLTGSTVPIQYSTGKKTPGGAGTQAHNTFQYTVITQLHTHGHTWAHTDHIEEPLR